ncbi:hypothetical protein LUD75_08355 [Epilithonimonas sp. JDS]|uniref:hypothetical protein n=1 Tax=Epilithonimonas sp. JDS TaxID=2902797 RepID=UPI001E2C7870|nr:hypothetical protein [Epilithonimonas sp. JDS]MCD9854716.1 hypothetical protein [Epilithonimonas sp. JDS]
MKKTEYFMSQMSYGQYQQCLVEVKKQRNDFISTNEIKKIVDENITVTNISPSHEINMVITLIYY